METHTASYRQSPLVNEREIRKKERRWVGRWSHPQRMSPIVLYGIVR